MTEQSSIIGLVAIGRNEGDRLKLCLRSIPANIPMVYVDSASTDESVAFAHSHGANVVELDMALPFTAARARNEGADALLRAHPETEYIQFVDGDCELEEGWFAVASNFLSADRSIAAVCGRRSEKFPDASFYNLMCDAEWNTSIGEANACGGDAMIRTTAFLQLGGYDSSMIAGEEPEFCQRLRGVGWRIWRLDTPMTIHDADMHRTAQWWRRAVRSGFGYAQVWKKTAESGRDILYRREAISALFWTFGVIFVALLTTVIFGLAGLAVAPLVWLAQLGRLAAREGFKTGLHLLLGKIAETVGIMRFVIGSLNGRKQGAIFYK